MSTHQTRALGSTDAPPLGEDLSERLGVGWRSVVFCTAVSAFFVYFDNVPIYQTDIWGHVSYGEWILEHRSLPETEPLLDLAEGVPLVDSAWLAQVAYAGVFRAGGAAWVSHVFALLMTGAVVVYAIGIWIRTGSQMAGLLGAVGILVLAPTRIAVARPESFGTLAFAILLLGLIVADRRFQGQGRTPWSLGIGIAILLCVWANLHGSFVVGLAVLACRPVGRLLEVWGREAVATRRAGDRHAVRSGLVSALTDRQFRFWLVVTELAIAASFLNPYGIDLLVNALAFPSNPNLADVLEWRPLPLISVEGITYSISWLVLVGVARFSRVRFRVHEVLALLLLNLAVIKGVRMISWYAAVFVFTVAPHVIDLVARWNAWRAEHWAVDRRPTRSSTSNDSSVWQRIRSRTLLHTAVCVLVLWWGFAFSPLGNVLLGGTPRSADRLYHEWTPIEVAQYLREHPSPGRVFNPQWWGDWLIREVPDQRFFMTTNALHVVPRRVWLDYLRVARAEAGWEEVLDRYDVSTVLVHPEEQRPLAARMEDHEAWELVYEDDLSRVYERRHGYGRGER